MSDSNRDRPSDRTTGTTPAYPADPRQSPAPGRREPGPEAPHAPPGPESPAAFIPAQGRALDPAPPAHPAADTDADTDLAPAPGPPRARVLRHSVRDQVLDALRAALLDGELAPGGIYSGPALATRFGVSATPVREAMQRLATEGAVECLPNRGFRVLSRTPRDLAELAEVRALLELPVMLRLARTVPPETWTALRPAAAATTTAAEAADLPAYAEADRAFHRAVLALAGNTRLLAVTEDLHRRAQWPLPGAPRARRTELLADAAEHAALLDALTAGDLPAAEALIHTHLTGPPR
ncbi:GntR family transcriptional regulator [Streptomyces sp. BI20]|uniref:GntR family transcriptional regulator n=1 Tax=Streptomyces sp. BI20 TaxID=3403460 RepID=UPI003C77E3A4